MCDKLFERAGNYKKPIVCVHPDISNFTDYLQRAPQTTATATDCPQPNNEPLTTVNDGVRKALNCTEEATTVSCPTNALLLILVIICTVFVFLLFMAQLGHYLLKLVRFLSFRREMKRRQKEQTERRKQIRNQQRQKQQQQQFKPSPLYVPARRSPLRKEEEQFNEASTGQKQQKQFKSHPLYVQARSSVREEEEDQFYEANTCFDHVYDTPANVPNNQNGEEEEDEWDGESEF
ncbi:hypothetical protein niasHT_034502 [Heterodera trifolii]|uniref:Uncharacterized protein n=1 Tax=Heterodera trifolii TaxID=157864 RepID=A0ABD2J0F9_9BILA